MTAPCKGIDGHPGPIVAGQSHHYAGFYLSSRMGNAFPGISMESVPRGRSRTAVFNLPESKSSREKKQEIQKQNHFNRATKIRKVAHLHSNQPP
jgi:hypothetical protein